MWRLTLPAGSNRFLKKSARTLQVSSSDDFDWSKNVLIIQIEDLGYEKTLLG
jgi:hypothetical protein